MNRTPNLASRPFRNERLPAVLLTLALVGLLGLSIKHALVLRGLLPSRTAAVEGEVRALDQELRELQSEAQTLPRPTPEARLVSEWQALRGLVDRRTFSWTRLLSRLEDVLPVGVKIASVAPTVKDGRITVEIAAVGRTITDGFGFMKVLEATPDFEDVVPSSVGDAQDGDGGEIRYRMKYTPATPPTPGPAPKEEESSAEAEPEAGVLP
jgi:Tfp pilus assembly protein PilN